MCCDTYSQASATKPSCSSFCAIGSNSPAPGQGGGPAARKGHRGRAALVAGQGQTADVFQQRRHVQAAPIDRRQAPFFVDQKAARQPQRLLAVEQLVMNELQHVEQPLAGHARGQSVPRPLHQRRRIAGAAAIVVQAIDRESQRHESLGLQIATSLIQLAKLRGARLAPACPQGEEHRLAVQLIDGFRRSRRGAKPCELQPRQRHRLAEEHARRIGRAFRWQARRLHGRWRRRRRPRLRLLASLHQAIPAVGLDSGKGLRLAAGPADHHASDPAGAVQPEVQPLARLRKEPLPGPQRSHQGHRLVRQVHFDTSANRIAVTGGAPELEGQKMAVLVGRQVVAHEADLRPAAIHQPQVEIAVEVPIDDSRGAGIVVEVQAADGRDIGEPPLSNVQETAVRAPGR